MLIIMICTALFVPPMDLMKMMMRFRAPVFSMNAICNSDAATMSETANERMSPAAVERRTTSIEVLKKNILTSAMATQPTTPQMSAGFLKTVSMHRMMTIGSKVHTSGMTDMGLPLPDPRFSNA